MRDLLLAGRLDDLLDREPLTLQIALRIVPVEWWAQRLGTTPSAWSPGAQQEPAQPTAS